MVIIPFVILFLHKNNTQVKLITWDIIILLLSLLLALINKTIREYFVKQPVFIFSLIFSCLSIIVLFINGINGNYEIFKVTKIENVTLGMLVAVFSFSLELWFKYKHIQKKYEEVKHNSNIVYEVTEFKKEPLKNYPISKLQQILNAFKNNIFGLFGNGFQGETKEKIEILEHILISQDKIENFRATTLDRPSELMKLDKFWTIQERRLKNAEKTRLVIITPDSLEKEISKHTKILIEFTKWHNQNGFYLNFIITTKDNFTRAVNSHFGKNNLLNDFAIIDNKIVYGEDFNSKLIRVFYNDNRDKDTSIINDYSIFFDNIIDRTKHRYDWTERSAMQIMEECNRMLDKKYTANQILDSIESNITKSEYLNSEFSKLKNDDVIKLVIKEKVNINSNDYNKFLTELFKFMTKDKNNEMIAIDLTPSKANFLTWIHNIEYFNWMQSTIDVANNGNKVSRLYILDEMETETNIEIIIDNIFLPQIRAGMTLYVVSEYELFNNDIHYFDMLYVKNKMCHSLNINQTLINEGNDKDADPDVSIELNLEHSNNFKRYEITFDKIINSGLSSLVKFDKNNRNILLQSLNDFYNNKLFKI